MAESVSYVGGQSPQRPVEVKAKIRYKAALAEATWTSLKGGRARVDFRTALRDITPGQAIVAYEGDAVLGGGIIIEAE